MDDYLKIAQDERDEARLALKRMLDAHAEMHTYLTSTGTTVCEFCEALQVVSKREDNQEGKICPAYREYGLQCILPEGHEGNHRGRE